MDCIFKTNYLQICTHTCIWCCETRYSKFVNIYPCCIYITWLHISVDDNVMLKYSNGWNTLLCNSDDESKQGSESQLFRISPTLFTNVMHCHEYATKPFEEVKEKGQTDVEKMVADYQKPWLMNKHFFIFKNLVWFKCWFLV